MMDSMNAAASDPSVCVLHHNSIVSTIVMPGRLAGSMGPFY